jgi:hypothetical protein
MAFKLKQDWLAVPVGAIYPNLYAAGTELTGELLERAKGLGKVEEVKPEPKTKAKAVSDGKA